MSNPDTLAADTADLSSALLEIWAFGTGNKKVTHLDKVIEEAEALIEPIVVKEVAEHFLHDQ